MTSHATPLMACHFCGSIITTYRLEHLLEAQHGEGWWLGYEVGWAAALGKQQVRQGVLNV